MMLAIAGFEDAGLKRLETRASLEPGRGKGMNCPLELPKECSSADSLISTQ